MLLCDSQGAIKHVTNQEFHKRIKHMDVKYDYVRAKKQDGTLVVDYVNTKEQLADIFKKTLSGPLFQQIRSSLRVNSYIQC